MATIAPRLLTIADRAHFQAVHESLYLAVEGLDASGYGYDESDAWTRARVPLQWTAHLETWVDMGTRVSFTRNAWAHQGSLIFGARYSPEDDGHSQAIAHAAIRDAAEALLRFHSPYGRIVAIGEIEIDQEDPSWLDIMIPFTLHLDR